MFSQGFLNNRLKLYTADQYNQLKASMGRITLPTPQTPQEAKIQRATTTGLTIRDKALVEYITKELGNPHGDQLSHKQALIKVLDYLENPQKSITDLF